MDKKYPIGDFDYEADYSVENAPMYIQQVVDLPLKVRSIISELSEQQIHTPYRENSLTPFQLIHHLGDSHINTLVRFKLAMTEDNPTIKPFNQDLWTALGDYELLSVEEGLSFLDLAHLKWVSILKTIKNDDWLRTFHHPETGINYTLIKALAMYAWHGNHHLAHIELVKQNS